METFAWRINYGYFVIFLSQSGDLAKTISFNQYPFGAGNLLYPMDEFGHGNFLYILADQDSDDTFISH